MRSSTPALAALLLIGASPVPRVGHAMAYDPQRRAVLLFGGTGDGPLGDLWAWDGRAWTELGASGPPPRELALAGYDTRRRRLVVNGGRARTATASETLTDTWEWDGNSWQQRSSAGPPDCLAAHAAYDSVRRKVLMLCMDDRATGNGASESSLWEWDGGTWQSLPGAGPVVRPVQPFVSLGTRGLLLFDGRGAEGTSGYTWLWDRSRWTRRGGPAPATRVGHDIAYDTGRRRTVLFGGGDRTRSFGDTWEWDGSRWRRAASP